MGWSKEEQYDTLDKFFRECVRFWERELKTDSDIDSQPYKNALKEVPKHNPYVPFNSPEFDKSIRDEFIKYRCMDIWGRNWECEYEKYVR